MPRRPRAVPVALGAVALTAAAIAGALALRVARTAPVARTAAVARTAPLAPVVPVAPDAPDVHCARISAAAWSPLPGVEYTGRVAITLPGARSGQMLLVVGDELPLAVEVETAEGDRLPVVKDRPQPPPDYWLEDGNPRLAPPNVQRLILPALPDRDRLLRVRFGRRAPRVLARLRGYDAGARAQICAATFDLPSAFAGGATEFAIAPSAADHFGVGWTGVERDPAGMDVRWMEDRAAVLVPSAVRGGVHVRVVAQSGRELAGHASVRLRVNNVRELPALAVQSDTAVYEWDVPAAAWVEGTNELLFALDGVPPRPAFMSEAAAHPFELAVREVRLALAVREP